MAVTPPPPSYGQLHLHRLIGQSLGYHGVIVLFLTENCIIFSGLKFRDLGQKSRIKLGLTKLQVHFDGSTGQIKVYIDPCSKADCYVCGPSLRQY